MKQWSIHKNFLLETTKTKARVSAKHKTFRFANTRALVLKIILKTKRISFSQTRFDIIFFQRISRRSLQIGN